MNSNLGFRVLRPRKLKIL